MLSVSQGRESVILPKLLALASPGGVMRTIDSLGNPLLTIIYEVDNSLFAQAFLEMAVSAHGQKLRIDLKLPSDFARFGQLEVPTEAFTGHFAKAAQLLKAYLQFLADVLKSDDVVSPESFSEKKQELLKALNNLCPILPQSKGLGIQPEAPTLSVQFTYGINQEAVIQFVSQNLRVKKAGFAITIFRARKTDDELLRLAAKRNDFLLLQTILRKYSDGLMDLRELLLKPGEHGWNTFHCAAVYRNEGFLLKLIGLVNDPALINDDSKSLVTAQDCSPNKAFRLTMTKEWSLYEIVQAKCLSQAQIVLKSRLRIASDQASAVSMDLKSRISRLMTDHFYCAYNMCGTLVLGEQGHIAADFGVDAKVDGNHFLANIVRTAAPFLFNQAIASGVSIGVDFTEAYLTDLRRKLILKMADNVVNFVGRYGSEDDWTVFKNRVLKPFVARVAQDFHHQAACLDDDGLREFARLAIIRAVHYIATDGLAYETSLQLAVKENITDEAKAGLKAFLRTISWGNWGQYHVSTSISDKVAYMEKGVILGGTRLYKNRLSLNTDARDRIIHNDNWFAEEIFGLLPMTVLVNGQSKKYIAIGTRDTFLGFEQKYGKRAGSYPLVSQLEEAYQVL